MGATGIVEALAGDLEASARAFEDGVALHREIGAQTGLLSTLAALHATVLYRLGRLEEMRPAVRLARETAAPNDVATQVEWRIAEAPLAADEGRLAEAGQEIKGARILRIGRTEGEGMDERILSGPQVLNAWRVFEHALAIWRLRKASR